MVQRYRGALYSSHSNRGTCLQLWEAPANEARQKEKKKTMLLYLQWARFMTRLPCKSRIIVEAQKIAHSMGVPRVPDAIPACHPRKENLISTP